jgi:hypothetical protein
VVAVGTLHHASPDSLDANDESHVWLVHDLIVFVLPLRILIPRKESGHP